MKLKLLKQSFLFFGRWPSGRICRYQEIRREPNFHGLLRRRAENLLAFKLANIIGAVKAFILSETLGYCFKTC